VVDGAAARELKALAVTRPLAAYRRDNGLESGWPGESAYAAEQREKLQQRVRAGVAIVDSWLAYYATGQSPTYPLPRIRACHVHRMMLAVRELTLAFEPFFREDVIRVNSRGMWVTSMENRPTFVTSCVYRGAADCRVIEFCHLGDHAPVWFVSAVLGGMQIETASWLLARGQVGGTRKMLGPPSIFFDNFFDSRLTGNATMTDPGPVFWSMRQAEEERVARAAAAQFRIGSFLSSLFRTVFSCFFPSEEDEEDDKTRLLDTPPEYHDDRDFDRYAMERLDSLRHRTVENEGETDTAVDCDLSARLYALQNRDNETDGEDVLSTQ
jgi:hypothetical protein